MRMAVVPNKQRRVTTPISHGPGKTARITAKGSKNTVEKMAPTSTSLTPRCCHVSNRMAPRPIRLGSASQTKRPMSYQPKESHGTVKGFPPALVMYADPTEIRPVMPTSHRVLEFRVILLSASRVLTDHSAQRADKSVSEARSL
jgi:hypothetical protein